MKRSLFILLALLIGGALLGPPAHSASEPYCGITWGSLAKRAPGYSAGHVTSVRTGRHECYDRLVVDIDGGATGYLVQYVDQVRAGGSGFVVPLRGGARLQIDAHAPAYDDSGNVTYLPDDPNEMRNVAGYTTFRQVAWAGSYEGETTIGLGVRARLPFRVFTLDGPGTGSRLVIDVAHQW